MKKFVVRITEKALADMDLLYDYIAVQLQAPDSAIRQYGRIADAINTLSDFPERCPSLHSQPEQSLGMHIMTVDNYAAIFIVKESSVTVLRVLYSASDIVHRLRDE